MLLRDLKNKKDLSKNIKYEIKNNKVENIKYENIK